MIKYMTLILLLMLGCGLLTGCYDPAVELAMSRADVKKINEASQRETERHQQRITSLENETEIVKLVKESGVYLSKNADIKKANYKAADSILWHLFWAKFKKPAVKLPKDAPILVASFVNLDDLSESSTFGRVVSEQIASRFNQKGYATIELKLGSNVFIKKGSGEFVLSREMKEIGIKHRAQAVIVGTYAVASKKVYITARVININDGRVLSSYDYKIPISSDVFKLLLKGKEKAEAGWL